MTFRDVDVLPTAARMQLVCQGTESRDALESTEAACELCGAVHADAIVHRACGECTAIPEARRHALRGKALRAVQDNKTCALPHKVPCAQRT